MDETLYPATWLLDNLYNKTRAYRYLGDADPADLAVFTSGWGGLMDEAGESGYVLNTYPDAPRFVGVPCTLWGDYCGDDVQRSNFRVLVTELAEYGVMEVRGDFWSNWLVLPADAQVPLWVLEGLQKLADEYPLWDESDHSELRSELEREDWESWARADFRAELYKEAGDDLEEWVANLPDSDLNDMAWQAMCDGTLNWEAETAVSGYFRGLEDLAKEVAALKRG